MTDEEVSDGLGCNPDVNAISLMGSTSTSPQIIVDAARTFRRVEVDFAGNNPVIVFPDADISACAQSCVHSCFTNKGEVCTCTRRIFVHRHVYSEFMAEFRSAVESRIRIGDPFNPDTFYGPFAYPMIVDMVADKIKLAQKEGATVEFWPHRQQVEEGKVVVDESTARATIRGCEGSLFLVPTIITGLKPSSAVATDLCFAPVISIFEFGSEDDKIDEKTEDHLIGMVNSVRRVICAAVWTKDFERFKRVANKLSAGYVWNNGWFLRDLSMHPGGQATRGYARNGVEDAIEFYSQAKTLVI
ncbi:Aldehyde dehydrogenase 8 member A1 [Spiromyces aspiralis]|uniref:Aldehyde dehydrogenase 8 member A1 n=1 Tax=Spiromyces aspiralis TaxID=68401 RepID=A0ACC1HGK7_9FUNG|nr:Aldehyde dehydrogenase 8 member A1 [Spiromyces aspiralis]